jgi:DEAD/DEAH box helicase domain-containing protein
MDTALFLSHLTSLPSYKNQIVHIEHITSRKAEYGELDHSLHSTLRSYLQANELLPLYSHQAQAMNLVYQGKNIMVVTPAASGKTLCYNIPVLDALLGGVGGRALYIFPTKALAQDQLRGLRNLLSEFSALTCATFDGDTPAEQRSEIKKKADIVLTNPDMLHFGILPNHQSWVRLFRRLKFIVVDEAHIYRGVFGSHLSHVLRRLRRLCALYGTEPQFICCSATIANPREHIERLVGLPFEVIDRDGSPHGARDFVFWNPPLIDDAKSTRRSVNSEATTIFTELVRWGIRSLTFARTRKLTELIYIRAREQLSQQSLESQIKPYRGGYLAEERREIERQLFEGQLRGVVTTTALELGVDIGDLDATVLSGYPGSIASTWQQAGRSGRGYEPAISFLLAMDNPLDQYLMRHPDFFFRESFENALTDPNNLHILKPHLLCAAWESPLNDEDGKLFGPNFAQAKEELEERGLLRNRNGLGYLSPTITYPAEDISIRSASTQYYTVIDVSQGNREIETVEGSVAFSQLHPGAVYLHQGQTYLVIELDPVAHIACVTPTDVPYYTQAKEISDLRIVEPHREKSIGGVNVYLGEVEVTATVIGFKKKIQFTEEVIQESPLNLPPQLFQTVALWFDIPGQAVDGLVRKHLDLAGGLHAVEHAAIGVLPLFALCDRNDIGGVSTPFHPDTGKPQIFIYDAHPGGIGIAERGFDVVKELWQTTLKVVVECPCHDGCPSCIQSPKCGNNNQPLDKKAAKLLLEELVRR